MLTKFKEIQDDFINELGRKGRSQNTLKNYKTDLECFNQFLEKQSKVIDLDKFNLKEMNGYDLYLQTRYPADNSRRRRIQTLRIFFDYLVEKSLVDSNPVRELGTSPKFLDIPRPAGLIDLKTLWTHMVTIEAGNADLEQLLLLRNQLMLCFIYGAALSVAELGKLKEVDILNSKEQLRVLITKERRDPYSIPLPQICKTLLPLYLELLHKKKSEYGLSFEELFFNANPHRILSGGLSPRGIEIVLEEYRKKLKIEITAKNIRQACIFCWMTEGKRDGQIKEWLGVAPSYSLKMYRDFHLEHLYSSDFLEDLYFAYKTKKLS